MIRLTRVLHPISTARSVGARLAKAWNGRRLRGQLRGVRRTSRELCWCGGALGPFPWHGSYGVCRSCGTFVNRIPPVAEDIQKIYSLGPYWHTRQRLRGFPAIEDRADLYVSDGRLTKWLDLVAAWSRPGLAIEIGCAPGALLAELARRGYRCLGVEASEDTAAWVSERTGVPVVTGTFPHVDLPGCDLFLAFDVLEHSPWPREFMARAAELLADGGVAIIQTAVERYGFTPPFGDRSDIFDDLEHLFLFTQTAIERLAESAGLQVVNCSQRVFLAGELVVLRKPEGADR